MAPSGSSSFRMPGVTMAQSDSDRLADLDWARRQQEDHQRQEEAERDRRTWEQHKIDEWVKGFSNPFMP
jgi:hypothetical protein